MTLSITQEQQKILQTFNSRGDYKGGWKYLASIGDNYADNAYAVTTGLSVSSSTTKKQIDDLMFHLVQKYWDTVAGPSAYSDKFSAVAEQHFRQYTDIILRSDGKLPNTDQIEKSYRDAVTDKKLPSEIAIDGAITRSFGEFFDNIWPGEKNESLDWGDALGMEDERQVPSTTNADLSVWQSLKDLLGSGFEAFWDTVVDETVSLQKFKTLFIAERITLSPDSAATALSATQAARRDPLVLDLDGDGIETTSSREGTVVLFDHDGDGVKTGTGWVKPDDGWLVMDRNGNGTIDSGRELFGVDTLKNNGTLAADGFDALKDLDANADGKISSTDAVFANLRIWRDLNQDGVSQSNELSTLSANNIVSIGVNASAVRTDLGNGNVQTAAGTFTRSNGSTGNTGETSDSNAANLDLLVDTFYREFTTSITLTDQAKALPNMKGSGQVRDLSEAISLSSALGNTVQTYAQQTTRDGQINRLDALIEQWANTSSMKSLKDQADALAGSGVSLSYSFQGFTAGSAEYNAFIRKLGIVERFMGFTYGGATGQVRTSALSAADGALSVFLQIDH